MNTAKMRAKGYSVPKIVDDSEASHITKFEYVLPLAYIDIDDFERRIKKLSQPN